MKFVQRRTRWCVLTSVEQQAQLAQAKKKYPGIEEEAECCQREELVQQNAKEEKLVPAVGRIEIGDKGE